MKLRTDKTWEQATTAAQFAQMYRNQIAAPARKPDPNEGAIRRVSEDRDEDDGNGDGDDPAVDGGEEDELDEEEEM